MVKPRLFFIVASVTALAACASPSVAAVGQHQTITMVANPGAVIRDQTGTSLLFQDDPTPIRFFLDARLERDQTDLDWDGILSAYRVSVMVDGKSMNPDEVRLHRKVTLVRYLPHLYCVVRVSPRSGRWPAGALILRGSFDTSLLRRNGLPNVELYGALKEIRVVCRAKKDRNDDLLRRRFEVWRWATGEQHLSPDYTRALQTVDSLLKAFPGDCYAHAQAGQVLEMQNRCEEAIAHYKQICKAIKAAYPQDPPYWLIIQPPNTVQANDKFRSLNFDYWLGKRGPQEIYGHFSHRIRLLEAFAPLLKSPYLLTTQDVRDPATLANMLHEARDPLAKHVLPSLTITVREWLHDHDGRRPPPESILSQLVARINEYLLGPCLYDKARFANVELRPATKALLDRWPPKRPDPAGQLQLNRMLLEDAWSEVIAREAG